MLSSICPCVPAPQIATPPSRRQEQESCRYRPGSRSCASAIAFGGLGGQKYVFSDALETDAGSLLRTAIPVGARTVEAGHANVIDYADMRRRRLNVRMEVHPGSALCDDTHLDAVFANVVARMSLAFTF